MSSDGRASSPWRSRAFRIALLAALPFVGLQSCFIANVDFWSQGMGPIFLAAIVIMLGAVLILFLVVEMQWRGRFSTLFRGIPWFALVGAGALLLFFEFASWWRPAVLAVPSWCRASQYVEWNTTLRDQAGTRHRFILALSGSGTSADYRLSSGYLNWTGPVRGHVSSIRLNPIRFQSDYYEEYEAGSLPVLRERIEAAGLPDDEADAIAAQIWDALKQAEQGRPIKIPGAMVGAVGSRPTANQEFLLGGLTWIAFVLVVFQLIGQLTLGPAISQRPP